MTDRIPAFIKVRLCRLIGERTPMPPLGGGGTSACVLPFFVINVPLTESVNRIVDLIFDIVFKLPILIEKFNYYRTFTE